MVYKFDDKQVREIKKGLFLREKAIFNIKKEVLLLEKEMFDL